VTNVDTVGNSMSYSVIDDGNQNRLNNDANGNVELAVHQRNDPSLAYC